MYVMRKISYALFFCWLFTSLSAQNFGKVEGIRDNRQKLVYALINAHVIHPDKPEEKNVVILIQNGKILRIGQNLALPKEAVVVDLQGRRVYPAFVELNSSYGLSAPTTPPAVRNSAPEYERNDGKSAWGWNRAVKPYQQAAADYQHKKEDAAKLRKQGFGAVLTHHQDGIVRGRGALVALSDQRIESENMLRPWSGAFFSFDKGSSTQQYPSSQMGAMALLRQTFWDLDWYNKNPEPHAHLQLGVLKAAMSDAPLFFSSPDKLTSVRAVGLGQSFNYKFIILGSGDEYQNLEEVSKTKARWVIPVNFPSTPDMADPWIARQINLRDLKHWELAPYNFKALIEAGLEVAISGTGTENIFEALEQIHKTGIDEQTLLRALTSTPASFVNMKDQLGSFKPGAIANLIVTNGPITSKKTKILESWMMGDRHVEKDLLEISPEGTWLLTQTLRTDTLNIKPKGQFEIKFGTSETKEASGKYTFQENHLNLSFQIDQEIYTLKARLTANTQAVNVRLSSGSNPIDAQLIHVSSSQPAEKENENPSESDGPIDYKAHLVFPFQAYGRSERPKAGQYLLTNATVWTLEGEGICSPCDVFISGGKIMAVGTGLQAKPGVKVIDATGKHITPGMIDEHSHIAISRGVNESGSSISSEVRIGDVINPEDINIYRQLAGGTTMSQLLHGSANVIGGQSALVKLRWGFPASAYPIDGAPGFIKFALGENVKQSNWGDRMTVRYPQSRMGVEQFLYESFFRANAYRDERRKNKSTRVDLELEALVEILESRRFISCHSYVQSEINMLMKVADSLGFTVNTFTHILEGYKVADKMKHHGAHASTFSDWWAYKMEVNEAIPFNAALLWKMGITTAINSDDAEMGRRLNQEAAKVVRYGKDVPEVEALKTVTLNPAKMLRLDHRLGSIASGKDADIVLWDHHPLQTYARVEKTFVDGMLLFDREAHDREVAALEAERQRLMQKALKAASGGAKTAIPESEIDNEFHCDTLEEFHYHGH
jgi:imidazolonepropionase-like amidohydrolase